MNSEENENEIIGERYMLLCAHTKIQNELNCRLLFHLLQRRQKNQNHFDFPLMLCFSYLVLVSIDTYMYMYLYVKLESYKL